MAVHLCQYEQLFLFPLAADSFDVSDVSEVDSTPLGKYSCVEASNSYTSCIL